MTLIHIDTDIGGDIDDACALAMVLNWPGVQLRGVTTVSDDRGRRAGYARYMLDMVGRQDVPVAAGADIARGGYRITPGLPDEHRYWPVPISPVPSSLDQALSLLRQSIEEGTRIVALGTLTNFALLEERFSGILRKANLFIMGGFLDPPRDGYPSWDATMDWNIQGDVHSASVVLGHCSPTLIPLSVTVETALRRAYLPQLRRAGRLGNLLARQAEAFAEDEHLEQKIGMTCAALPDDIINFLHDPLACAVALDWTEGITLEEVSITTELHEGWLRQRYGWTGNPVRLVRSIDGGKFSEFWLDRVTGRL